MTEEEQKQRNERDKEGFMEEDANNDISHGFELTRRRGNSEDVENAANSTLDTHGTDPSSIMDNQTSDSHKISNEKICNGVQEKGIGRGVILNAMNVCAPNDFKWITDKKAEEKKTPENEVKKDTSLTMKGEKEIEDEKTGMTLVRKFVFGLSFLPSVLFVLCFAVFLPCEEVRPPEVCVKKLWNVAFNDSEISTKFLLTNNGLLTGIFNGEEGLLIDLGYSTGKQLWQSEVESKLTSLNCRPFDESRNTRLDCVSADDSGTVRAFDSANGSVLWSFPADRTEAASATVLSDCDSDGVNEVAITSSNSEIQIVSNGLISAVHKVKQCNAIMKNLELWNHENVTDLVFLCHKEDGNQAVIRITQNAWCSRATRAESEQSTTEATELLSFVGFKNELSLDSILLMPFNEELVVWSYATVTVLTNNGTIRWAAVVDNYLNKRSLAYGKFLSDSDYFAFLSSDVTNKFSVTFMNSQNPNETVTWDINNAEYKYSAVIKGKNRDFLLLVYEDYAVPVNSLADNITTIMPVAEKLAFTSFPTEVQPLTKASLLQLQKKDNDISVREKQLMIQKLSFNNSSEPNEVEFTAFIEDTPSRSLVLITNGVFEGFKNEEVVSKSELNSFRIENWDPDTEKPLPCS